jgi:hypothetical protein
VRLLANATGASPELNSKARFLSGPTEVHEHRHVAMVWMGANVRAAGSTASGNLLA